MTTHYDVTIITVRPGVHSKALAILENRLAGDKQLLACWYCDIGALNQIMLISNAPDPAASLEARQKILSSPDPFGLGDLTAGIAMDTFVSFDFLPPIQPGAPGPCYEVRSYELKPHGLTATAELWHKAVAARSQVSPVLAAMTSVTGVVIRFVHIWPYKTLEERSRLRAKAVADGVWPPPGGPDLIARQQTDIFLPASFSPLQ